MNLTPHGQKLLAETGVAQNALWGSIASVAGLIIGAASVLTALADKKEPLAFMLVVALGALSMWMVLGCSWCQKSYFLSLLTGEIDRESIDSRNHRHAGVYAAVVPWAEKAAMLFVAGQTIPFIYLCLKVVAVI